MDFVMLYNCGAAAISRPVGSAETRAAPYINFQSPASLRGHRDRCSLGQVVMEHPANRREGIPVASGRRDAVEPVKRTEISDDLHMAPVHPDDESISSRDDLHQPSAAGRKLHRR